jgi:hypothetical protein
LIQFIVSRSQICSSEEHCQDTGLWKLNLDYEFLGCKYPDQFIAGVEEANAIFDLPNPAIPTLPPRIGGVSPKETFSAAVRAGNYAACTKPMAYIDVDDKDIN